MLPLESFINKMFFNKKNQFPAAQVAMLPYMDWFETSLSAKCEIPLAPFKFCPPTLTRETVWALILHKACFPVETSAIVSVSTRSGQWALAQHHFLPLCYVPNKHLHFSLHLGPPWKQNLKQRHGISSITNFSIHRSLHQVSVQPNCQCLVYLSDPQQSQGPRETLSSYLPFILVRGTIICVDHS